ncbi:MAG: xylulokinase [Candidatus Cloacimonetes bacterium]|nr:xylulokinase [Candidatus Cloacimonadota bacterium]
MYLGIDLGTTSVKLLIMESNGQIIRTLSKSYDLIFPRPGWAEQNPDEWWNATQQAIKEILLGLDSTQLKGISFSGQMHGLVILDENDEVIRTAILWCDQRTEQECDYLNNEIGKEKIYEYTGNIALTGFTAPKLLWLKNHELENFRKIKKIMLPKDFLAYKLSGVFASDYSDASGMLLLNVREHRWSDEMLEIIGINKNQLPALYESYEVIGTIKSEHAVELGIPKTTKIIIGGGDQAVGAVGTGAVEEGIISVALGTSGVVFAPTDTYIVDAENRMHSFAHANGKYHQMGVMLSAAGALKWWVEDVHSTTDYALINREIATASDTGSLYFLPYLIGERTPHNDPQARGAFIGLALNHKRGEMSKAVIEGVSYALKDSLEILKSMGLSIIKVRISGGGSKSRIWNQLIADVFNLEIATIEVSEGPAFGAAILAAVGCGEYPSVISACRDIIRDKKIFYPDETKVDYYHEKYEIFRKLYPALRDTFKLV